jgi:hypothetical protein
MTDDRGRTVRFEPIEGDDEHVRMIETFDLRHPRCPIVLCPPWPPVKPPENMVSVECRNVVSKFAEAPS